MTEMINLIVPPIIVVFAVAALIVFLAKKLPSNQDGGRFILKKDTKKTVSESKKKSSFFQKKKPLLAKLSKEEEYHFESGNTNDTGDNTERSQTTQGIVTKKGEKIVSLRKKSMVSDKIENAKGRDPVEIDLMKEIESDPHNSKKYEKLGDYYMEHEQFKDARECYKYVLRLDPRHKRAQVAMRNLDRVL